MMLPASVQMASPVVSLTASPGTTPGKVINQHANTGYTLSPYLVTCSTIQHAALVAHRQMKFATPVRRLQGVRPVFTVEQQSSAEGCDASKADKGAKGPAQKI